VSLSPAPTPPPREAAGSRGRASRSPSPSRAASRDGRATRAVPVVLVPRGEQPRAIASSSGWGSPAGFGVQCCPSPSLFLDGVGTCVRTFPPGTVRFLLCFKVPALPPREEITGVKEFTSRASEDADLSASTCREVWGCRGAAVAWRVCPWCPSCRWLRVQEGQSQLFSQPLSWRGGSKARWWTGTDASGCARCSVHRREEGCAAKPLHRASPEVWGPQTGSSAPGTLGSGLGVSSGEAALNAAVG